MDTTISHTSGFLVTLVSAVALTVAAESLRPRPEEAPEYPPSRRVEHVDTYHGVRVQDPYRWLEDLASDETRAWMKAQDDFTAARIEAHPSYEAHHRRLAKMLDFDRYITAFGRGGRVFIVRTRGSGTTDHAVLVDNGDGRRRVLLDARTLFPDGERTLSAFFSPSPDGELLVYGSGRSGSRWNRLHVLRVGDGERLEELEGFYTGLPGLTWTPDGEGFYYTRFTPPKEGEELQAQPLGGRIFYHQIGTPQSKDVLVYADSEHDDRWFLPTLTEDGRFLVVRTSRAADVGHRVIYLDRNDEDAGFRTLVAGAESRMYFEGSRGRRLWFQTDDGAPNRRLIAIDVDRPEREDWVEVIAESDDAITNVDLVAERWLVTYTHEARPLVKIFDLEGRFERELPLPGSGISWGGFVGRRTDREAFFQVSSLADPGTIFRLDPKTGKTSLLVRPELAFDPDDYEIRQVFYKNREGLRIPMFLAHKKGLAMSPENRVFLYGYGAMGWSAFPWFQPHVVAWMADGGIYAMPGIRGGGEYGDTWHRAGIRRHKQNAVDDFVDAARWLVDRRWTSRQRLVANGGSASGVIVAAALVEQPELFGAAIVDIPAVDMLRFERFTGGAYWVTEYGTVEDPEEFRALRALSPYHNLEEVEEGTCIPPTLITAGERDETTVPSHAYKFTAALQRSQGCAHPALLQVVWGAGHGFGTTVEQSATTWARQLSFLDAVLEPDAAR